MKRFNCDKAGCEICSKATVVKGFFGTTKYKCSSKEKAHKNVKAKDCLDFRCNSATETKVCRLCRKGERRR